MNVTMPNGDVVAFPDDMPKGQIASLIEKKFPNARREAQAATGAKPYQNVAEVTGTVLSNLPASWSRESNAILQQTGESLVQSVDPRLQVGLNAPIEPGMTTEEMLNRPAAQSFEQIGPGKLLPMETRKAIAETGARMSLAAQLRKQQAEAALAANPVDARPGSIESYAGQAAGAVVEMAPLVAASVFARNPAPLATYFAGRSLGSGFAEAQAAGAGAQDTAAVGALYATAEALSEAIGGKILLDGGKTLVGSLVKGAVGEGLTEGLTEAIQALVDRGYIQPDMTIEEAASRIKDAAIVGAMAGGTVAPAVHALGGKETEPEAPGPQTAVEPPEDVVTVEDSLALPAPETLLALPAPGAPPVVTRRQPAAPAQAESPATPEQEIDYQAQVALRRTRQAETEALLQTARETVSPLGSFTADEIPGPALQRVNTWRAQTGRSIDTPITVEEMARAKVPQSVIDAVITARRPMTRGQVVVPKDIRAIADAKNIIADDDAFSELAFRTTGQRNIDRMSQAQLSVLKSTVESLPSHESRVTLPIADAPAFDEGQYNKSLDAIRNQGRFTLGAVKDAAGVKDDGIARSIRDAMVRRGQLVQRGKNDFRLYDVLGAERQAVPDDLPQGAFSEYVVKKTPVNRIQIKVGGKSIGTFGSGTEARNKIRELRAKEAEKGGTPSQIELGQAEESAYAVMENRYDEAGNLLGQVAVDTSRDETAARKLAEQRNNPDTGARYTQTLVTPDGATQPAPKPKPKRGPTPAALAGRTEEVIAKLNAAAKERALPLLGTTVKIVDKAKAPNGEVAQGLFLNNVISITAGNLEPGLTTDQVVDRLAQVMDHELVHALKRAGVLAPESAAWKTLSKYVSKTRRPDSGETYLQFAKRMYAGVPGYNTEADMVEEAIAEAFRVWASNRRNVVGQPATAFRQLVEWFKRLFNALPDDIFSAIESGSMVRAALTPPGADQPRAVAAEEMAAARKEIAVAQAAKDENAVRVASRSFLRARDQAREDRLGRSGPKTVIGTTPSRAFAASAPVPRNVVDDIVNKYRASAGISTKGLATLLPEDVDYLARIADAQQRAVHDPADNAVAKAYRALTTETRSMFDALGITEIARWTEDGQPYASVDEMFADMAAGRLKLRLSADMFGEGADNPGHPMYKASGVKAADGTPLTFNDLFRVVHDVYGRAPIGLKRDSGRDDYNAYHEHARLVSDDARKALATETLAQGAWHHYGPHLRRKDGTVPRERDVDYLAPERKEFAEQKAFLLDEKLIAADPGWALAEKADAAVVDAGVEPTENARLMVAWHGTPHNVDQFSLSKIGTGEGAQAFGHGLYFAGKKEVADHYRGALSPKAHGLIDGQRTVPTDVSLEGSGPALSFIESVGSIERAQAELRKAAAESPIDRMRAHYTEAADWIDTYRDRLTVSGSGNLYKVDIPEDNELLDWDAPMREQPQNIQDAVVRLLGTEIIGDMSGEAVYDSLSAKLAKRPPTGSLMERIGTKRPSPEAASEALKAAGIPGHRYFDSLSRDKGDGSRNYVIYDDSRIQIVDVNPKFSLYDDHLPGGRLYGNAERSPGGAVSAPDTVPPAFSKERDGNQFFGGDMADEQLRMAQVGERGTTMLYLSPDEFLALAGNPDNPEQAIYNGLVNEGYKFNTLPSLVLDGYAGKVRAVDSDGAYAVNALAGRAERIPVAIYPKRGENLGLVSAIDGNGVAVPWPADGRAENYLDERGEEPKYMVTAQYGNRVPREQFNIIDQRVETWVGKRLSGLGRSKRELPLPKGVKEAVGGTIFDMRVKFQDRMLSVKEMIENVQAMGGEVTDKTDVYMAEQLAGSRTVQEVEHREATLYDPLFAALEREAKAKDPIIAKDFEDFLYARHAPERNAYLRAAGSKVPNPSGMSDAEAEAILDKAALDGKLTRFEDLAAMVDAITADTTNTRVAAGLISPDNADQSPYQYYVPLRGKDQEDLDPDDVYDRPARARSGKGYTVGGKEDRSAVGRSRKAGDILASVMLQNTESVIRSEKNRVALSFMRLLQANPNTGYGTILSSAPTRMVRGANGQIREAGDPSFRNQPDIFTAKWKGKEIVARVEDPRVARAMRADYVQVGGEPSILDKFVAGASRLNRYLATINTSWNPEFLISNVARDAQTAAILGAQYDIEGFSRKIITGAPAAVLAIREVLRDGTASTPLAERFQEMQKAGGTTEFLGIHDLDTHIKRLRGDAARTGWQPTMRQAFNRIQTIGKFIDDYNKVAENAFRLGAYNEARNAGVSIDRAAFLAKNLTVNFNKGGEQKALMNSLYLFYNASISGTFVLLNGLKNRRVQKIVAGIVAAGILQDVLNRMMSGDDDENGIKDYDDIPDYVLETNWVFMIPGSKEYVSIPMPYGFNFFHNLGRNMSNAVSGSPAHSPGKSAMSTLMTAIDAFNPVGGANSPLNFIAPTFADPLVDLATNTDFAGNDIVPDRPTFGLDVPDSQKYWANTGEIPKWAAEQLNRLTGGNEVRPGAIDVSPEVLQFWVDYATGATGKFITRNVGLGQDVVAGNFEDIEIGDIPFARRVVGSVSNRGNTERYYENATEIKTVAEELELAQDTGDRGMLERVLADKAPEVRLIETFAKAEKELSALRKQIRELKADEVLPLDRKREMIRALEEQQDSMMSGLNRLYYEAKGFALPPR